MVATLCNLSTTHSHLGAATVPLRRAEVGAMVCQTRRRVDRECRNTEDRPQAALRVAAWGGGDNGAGGCGCVERLRGDRNGADAEVLPEILTKKAVLTG